MLRRAAAGVRLSRPLRRRSGTMTKTLAMGVTVAAMLTGCAQSPRQCSVDPPGGECSDGEVCAGPLIAVDGPGVCRLACDNGGGCPGGQYCMDDFVCLPYGECHRAEDCDDPDNDFDRAGCADASRCVC